MAPTRDDPSVLLIEPGGGFDLTYPLGLGYLAGHLRRAAIAVRGVDLRIDPRSRLIALLKQQRFDLVGIRVMSTTVEEARGVATLVRQLQPSARLVVGGPHATLAPADALRRIGADAAIRGDGEVPLVALVRGESNAPGVVRPGGADSEVYVHAELGDLDFPDRTTFPMDRYYRQGSFGSIPRTAMIASRGCFRRCGYCSANALSLGSFRKRQPEAVVEEIRRLGKEHGVRGFVFEDDAMLLDADWARALFAAIAARAPGAVIDLPNGVNPDLLDETMLDVMAEAGVRSIAFGLESLGRDNLYSLDRVFDRDHLEAMAAHARKRGIATTGYFLIGLPHDTPRSLLSEFAAIRRLPLDIAHVSVFRRLPGQPLQSADAQMSEATLRALRSLFYATYYATPSRAVGMVRRAGGGMPGALRLAIRAASWLRG